MDERKNNLARVREVLSRHRDALRDDLSSATGTAIGHVDPSSRPAPEDDGWRIVVYVKSDRDRPTKPVSIEGVPLAFVVTGEFVAE